MKMLMVIVSAALLATATWAGESFAYQGVLKSGTGAALTELAQVIEFRLYTEADSDLTTAIWGRKLAVRLDANGLFNVELSDSAGSAIDKLTNTLDVAYAKSAKMDKELYIGLLVAGSSGEIRPRQRLLSTPMSSYAHDVSQAKGDFTVSGIATFNSTVKLGNDAKFVGAAKFQDAATFTQAPTFSAGINVAGSAKFTQASTFSQPATFNNGISVTGGTYGAMPVGTIVMWWGDPAKLPGGWELCDGTNDKPNLIGRFPVGAGGSYAKGAQGGSETVTLTTEQMPAHTHETKFNGNEVDFSNADHYVLGDNSFTQYKENMTTKTTSSTGGGAAHENRPPYTAIYFIIRVK